MATFHMRVKQTNVQRKVYFPIAKHTYRPTDQPVLNKLNTAFCYLHLVAIFYGENSPAADYDVNLSYRIQEK